MWDTFDPNLYFFIPKILEYEFNYKCNFTSIEKADVVIHSVFDTYDNSYNNNAKNIFITGENVRPPLNQYDFSLGFDYINNDKYLRFPLWKWFVNYKNIESYENTYVDFHKIQIPNTLHEERKLDIKDKKFAACAFIGNPEPTRINFIEKLKKHMPVDIYGRYSNSVVKDKKEIADKYQFIVCFENSIFPGYHTEKLPDAYKSESIPIYYSDKTDILDFNKNCRINKIEYSSDDDLIEYILSLSNNQKNDILNAPLLNSQLKYDDIIGFINKWI